jgi:hypothetical protein
MSGPQQREVVGTEEVLHCSLLVGRTLEGLLDRHSMRWLRHGEVVVGAEEAVGIHHHRCNYPVHSRLVAGSRLAGRNRLGCSRSRRIQT